MLVSKITSSVSEIIKNGMCKFCSQHKAQVYKNKSLKTLSHNLWAQIEIALRLWKQLLKSTRIKVF